MIAVQIAELADVEADAVMRPVSSDFSPVTAAMRRLDQTAGSAVAEQCARLGELPAGSAVITAGGGIRAGFIVHIVVRTVGENPTAAVVRRGLQNGLRRLVEWEIESVALAPLGTGAGNLDAEEAAVVMLPVLAEHLRTAAYPSRVLLVTENAYERSVFEAAVERLATERAGSGP